MADGCCRGGSSGRTVSRFRAPERVSRKPTHAERHTNEFRAGLKLIVDGDPCSIIENEFVKPGKGQAFVRAKFRNLRSGRVIERTFKSGESVEAADVLEVSLQFIYSDGDMFHFMDEETFEQHAATPDAVAGAERWLKEQDTCTITLWNGTPIAVTPPNFVTLRITETDPACGAIPRAARPSRRPSRPGPSSRFRCSSSRASSSGSTPAPASTSRAPVNEPGLLRDRVTRAGECTPARGPGDGTAGATGLRLAPGGRASTRSGCGARVLRAIRAHFDAQGVLEVETPSLGARTVTDPTIESLVARDRAGRAWYLQTSPEFAMKRLLAAGSGSIYQITRAFRDGEEGRHHNLEFSMLEWYRVGYDHHRLIDDVDVLLDGVLGPGPSRRMTFRDAFSRHLDLDPSTASPAELHDACRSYGFASQAADASRDECPRLAPSRPRCSPRSGPDGSTCSTFRRRRPRLRGYARALRASRSGSSSMSTGSRSRTAIMSFWMPGSCIGGCDGTWRRRPGKGRPVPEIDERLLAAHEAGLPACAGVAVGLDRLVMLAGRYRSLREVLAFAQDTA